jgi:hypothetical protein
MKASAGMADQSRYQKWVSAINENVARRNTEAMSQAQQNNAMALDRAQLMQGSERLRVESANARNTLNAGVLNTAAYADQTAATAANNQFNANRAIGNDDEARKVAASTQGLRNRVGAVLGASTDGDLLRNSIMGSAILGRSLPTPQGSALSALAGLQDNPVLYPQQNPY